MTIPLQVTVLPLRDVSEIERREIRRPQTNSKFVILVDRTEKFESIWTRIEDQYKRDYLTPTAQRLFVIKKIMTSYGFDIETTLRFEQVFDCDRPDRDRYFVTVAQAALNRESSILSTSLLRPAIVHKRHREEAASPQNIIKGRNRQIARPKQSHQPPEKRQRLSHPSSSKPIPSTEMVGSIRSHNQFIQPRLPFQPTRQSSKVVDPSPDMSTSPVPGSDQLGEADTLDSVTQVQDSQPPTASNGFSENGVTLVDGNDGLEVSEDAQIHQESGDVPVTQEDDEYGEDVFSGSVAEMLDSSQPRSTPTSRVPPLPNSQHNGSNSQDEVRLGRRRTAEKHSHWTVDEDKTLDYIIIKEIPKKNWSKLLPGRTDQAVRCRIDRRRRVTVSNPIEGDKPISRALDLRVQERVPDHTPNESPSTTIASLMDLPNNVISHINPPNTTSSRVTSPESSTSKVNPPDTVTSQENAPDIIRTQENASDEEAVQMGLPDAITVQEKDPDKLVSPKDLPDAIASQKDVPDKIVSHVLSSPSPTSQRTLPDTTVGNATPSDVIESQLDSADIIASKTNPIDVSSDESSDESSEDEDTDSESASDESDSDAGNEQASSEPSSIRVASTQPLPKVQLSSASEISPLSATQPNTIKAFRASLAQQRASEKMRASEGKRGQAQVLKPRSVNNNNNNNNALGRRIPEGLNPLGLANDAISDDDHSSSEEENDGRSALTRLYDDLKLKHLRS